MAGVWELRRMPSGGGLLDWCWTAICVTRHGIMILVDVINSGHPHTAGAWVMVATGTVICSAVDD